MKKRRQTGHSVRKQSEGNLVVGANACRELLASAPSRVLELWIDNEKSHAELIAFARSANVSVHIVERDTLTERAQGVNHQGIIAKVSERPQEELSELIERLSSCEAALLVAVDELYDPQNFGSILRASECFGADGVIWSRNRGVTITPAVTKVSAGASELLPMCPVSNLRNALLELKRAGFWVCVAGVGGSAQSIYDVKLPEKVVVVLGSEGKGVQPLIQKEADFLLEIPMLGKIDSLNVAQATAVFLATYRSHNRKHA